MPSSPALTAGKLKAVRAPIAGRLPRILLAVVLLVTAVAAPATAMAADTPPAPASAETQTEPQAPAKPPPPFPTEAAKALLARLDAMMVTADHRKMNDLIWDGLPAETSAAWREAMKHEFRQIAYSSFQTSIYDWRYISADEPRESNAIPEQLPPTAGLWAVRVDIDYRYAPKSQRDSADPAAAADQRDELATVLFYLVETEAGLRIVGSDRNYFMQFGQALPRGVIGTWAIALITVFLTLVFWITMASHCWATRPKLRHWRWITAALPVLGALSYFFWVYWRAPRRPLFSMTLMQNLRQSLAGVGAESSVPIPTAPAPVASAVPLTEPSSSAAHAPAAPAAPMAAASPLGSPASSGKAPTPAVPTPPEAAAPRAPRE